MIFEQYKRDFMERNIQAAEAAEILMPAHAAAAAALESGYGLTEEYIAWNNPFGVSCYGHPKHGLHFVPQAAFEGKAGWSRVSAPVSFDTLTRCYQTLRESVAILNEAWPPDSEADTQLEEEADALAYEYLLGLERGFDQ